MSQIYVHLPGHKITRRRMAAIHKTFATVFICTFFLVMPILAAKAISPNW